MKFPGYAFKNAECGQAMAMNAMNALAGGGAKDKGAAKSAAGASFAYSPAVHPAHVRRDRVAPMPPRRSYGAAAGRGPAASGRVGA